MPADVSANSSPAAEWSAAEARAWAPPERVTPSQWAERYRVLPPSLAAEAGPWRNDRTPYLIDIMDAVLDPHVAVIVVLKAAQVGFSECLRNLLGYWIDQDPGPAMLVMPSEASAREQVEERIRPLIHDTPQVSQHLTGDPNDVKLSAVRFDSMTIYTGWAGSPQALATRPIRYLVCDEVDKFPSFAGKEADPISLALKRLTTYGHRAKAIIGSTPTTRHGAIWKWWEAAGTKLDYATPCPHCGEYQVIPWQQIKWDKVDGTRTHAADTIVRKALGYVECRHCKRRIVESHKAAMLRRGRWITEGQTVQADGTVTGDRPQSRTVGFRLPAILSPWVSYSQLAGEWLACDGDPGRAMDFRNSRLAEPFEELASTTKPSSIRDRAAKAPPSKIVPQWAEATIATADTQKDHWYWVLRSWSKGMRSQLVDFGVAYSWEQLLADTLNRQLSYGGGYMQPIALLVDSGGSRTEEIYQLAAQNPAQIRPCKGASNPMRQPYQLTRIGTTGVYLTLIDTGHYKDMLHRLVSIDPDVTRWQVCRDVNDDYIAQMASEHKVLDPKTRKLVWTPTTSHAANHFWDCEVLQCAAADMANFAQIVEQPQQAQPRPAESSDWVGGHRGRW